MKKKALNIFFAAVILALPVLFAACAAVEQTDHEDKNWGSFTSERTESHDHKYYAVQTAVDPDVVVTIYNKETDEKVFSFSPARASDFWGICWESDSYNIWIQSADIGIKCYRYDNGNWILDENAERPADIISKYEQK